MGNVSLAEVEDEAMEMEVNKAPHLNGFTTNLFQACQPILKSNINLVKELRTSSLIILSFNVTLFIFVSKYNDLANGINFHLIALSNVTHKIITKVISNHLNPFLPYLISRDKSKHVEGQQILDGIIVECEVIHCVNNARKFWMVINIDLPKYFYWLNLSYILQCLQSYTFLQKWRRWIGLLISSPFLSIILDEQLN